MSAAQALDLDRLEGMRSETVIGACRDTWQVLPQTLTRLVVENEFIFQYLKYETLRAEVNYGIRKKQSQILWDDKFQAPEVQKLGVLAGIVSEVVSLGSTKRGLSK